MYGQCGGEGYSGATVCSGGASCVSLNPYYYQCLSTSGSSPTATSTNSSTSGSLLSSTEAPTSTSSQMSSSSTLSTSTTSSESQETSSTEFSVVENGFSGSGKTTRYFDCCKPSYAWDGKSSAVSHAVYSCDANGNKLGTNVQSACSGGSAFMCNDQVPWAVTDDLSYGFAAASVAGSTDQSLACTCMKLKFTSGSVSGKTMVVQITNTGSDLGSNQFDLLMPAGGAGIFGGYCASEFGSGYDWGNQYGGISSETECADIPETLQTACEWRFTWFGNSDNPNVEFEQVVCPRAITDISGCSRTDE